MSRATDGLKKKRTKPARAKSRGRAATTSNTTTDTRLAIMRTAERLMAERGIDAVSLREVSAEAGQLNNSAVLYHFGSRDGLIDACLERHSQPIHERWAAQLDFIDRNGGAGLRVLVEMLVVDIVNKLDDPDGGWEYLSLCGQLSLAPQKPLVERGAGNTPTVHRLMAGMLPYYPSEHEILPLRFSRMLFVIYGGILAYRRLEVAGAAPVSRPVFSSELVDTVVSMIQQPLSEETSALLSPPRAEKKRGKTTKK